MEIEIGELKELSERLNLTHVVVFSYDGEKQQVATYGRTTEQSSQAADFGNQMKDSLGWPASLHAQPARVVIMKKAVDKALKKLNSWSGFDGDTEMVAIRDILDEASARVTANPPRPIPATNEIKTFFHCRKCMSLKPADVSPQEWGQLDVGFSVLGIQVWCKRCECNVVHCDFEGIKHPANKGVA